MDPNRKQEDSVINVLQRAYSDADASTELRAKLCLSREHFQVVYERMCKSPWSSCSPDWVQETVFVTPAHRDDSCTDPVLVSSSTTLSTYRDITQHIVNLSFPHSCPEDAGSPIKVYRLQQQGTRPPPDKTRYNSITVYEYREFTRVSSQFSKYSTLYKMCVEWRAECKRDLETALPTYSIEVCCKETTVNYTECSDRAADASWLATNLLCKVADMALCKTKDIQIKLEDDFEGDMELDDVQLDDAMLDEYWNEE